ncbi:PTS transporter subunit EIIC, partial [Staphylococcus saprophyticus]|uniref:PTS transporter subunit EIIC n=1 Tax=Staphylococcus saprophyticus TaxID=29385 RepID=UPI0021B26A49
MTPFLHNKFHKISLPPYLPFFPPSPFLPIITSLSSILLPVVIFFISPTVQPSIFRIPPLLHKTPLIPTFFFPFIFTLLPPFPLHHIFYLPFCQTPL